MAIVGVLLGPSYGGKSSGSGRVVSLQIHAVRVVGSGRGRRKALLYKDDNQHIMFRSSATLAASLDAMLRRRYLVMMKTYLLLHLHVRAHRLDSVPALDNICLQ